MINFGISILIGLASYLVVFGLVILGKKILKKDSFKTLIKDLNNLYCVCAYLVVYLILLLVVYLTYSRTTYFSVISLSLGASLCFVFVPFKSFINKLRTKQFKQLKVFDLVKYSGIVIILLLESLVFSNVASKKDDGLTEIPFNSELIVESDGVIENGKYVFSKQRQYIVLDNRDHSMHSIYLDLECDVDTKTQIDFFVSTNNEQYDYAYSFPSNPKYDEFEYYDMSEISDKDYIQVVFVIDETNVHDAKKIPSIRLKRITVNKAFPFVFNALRFVLIEGAFIGAVLIVQKGRKLTFKSTENTAILERIILMLCGVGLIFIIVTALIKSSTHFVIADQVNGKDDPIYYQIFNSLKNGHVHLDFEPSPELMGLENPYDPSARGGISYLWDHAYFNGKYYCYYGLTPVLLVMFPIYWLSGCKYIPSILLIEEIGTLFSILTFLLVIIGLVRLMFKEVNMPILIFLLVGSLFTSLLLSNTIYKVGYYNEGIYRVPYSYGMCFFFLMILMAIKAFNNSKLRILHLGFLGLAVVLLVGTRPTLLFGFILIIPIFIKILLEKYSWKRKLIDLAPMVGIVIVGAALICYYNYIRFNSIFEFGQSYQLTVVDGTKLSYSVQGIIPTLANYYIMPPHFGGPQFPYISYGWGDFFPAYHSYNAGSIGLLFFPILWGMFALPFVFDKKDNIYLRIMFYLSPFVIFLIAFTIYCFGGVCPRYDVELTAMSMALFFVPLLKVFEALYKKKPITSIVSLALVVFVSVFISFNLLFCGFDGWIEGDQFGLLEVIRSVFNEYNMIVI